MTKLARGPKFLSFSLLFPLLAVSCSNLPVAGRNLNACADFAGTKFAYCLIEADKQIEGDMIMGYLAQRGDPVAKEYVETVMHDNAGEFLTDEDLGL